MPPIPAYTRPEKLECDFHSSASETQHTVPKRLSQWVNQSVHVYPLLFFISYFFFLVALL